MFRKHPSSELSLPKRAVIQKNFITFRALRDAWHELHPDNRSRDTEWKTFQELAEQILNQR